MGVLRWCLYKLFFRDYFKIARFGREARLKIDLTKGSKIKKNINLPKTMKYKWRYDYYLFLNNRTQELKFIKLLKRKCKSNSILLKNSNKYEEVKIKDLDKTWNNEPLKLQYKDLNFFLEIYPGPKDSLAIEEGFVRCLA